MKKKLLFSLAFFLTVCAASLFVVASKKVDFCLYANVEALASGETSSGGGECYRTLIYDPSDQVVYCGNCKDMPGRGRRRSVCYNF